MNIKYFSVFGHDRKRQQHHFEVYIPSSKEEKVIITENFIEPDPDLLPVESDLVKPRVILERKKWDSISTVLRHEFNGRVKKSGGKKSNWKLGYNLVPTVFGKELVLLAWAIETVELELIPLAIQNWLGLVPEERWWLYTQANAATGHAEKGRGRGWRRAIQVALTENPVGESLEVPKRTQLVEAL